MVFTLAVLNANIKILLISYSYNIILVLSVLASIGLYVFNFDMMSRFVKTSDMFGVLEM